MAYQYPERKTGNTAEDLRMLWDTVWRLVEQLNDSDEAIRAALARLEDGNGLPKT